ncbi:hypothetical protein CEXT_319621 [Caerostris extrusa]|uniref:Uncharacterized protein n=1 Tax=Caerostris extrusa TaxID=172846 RepID=A0AAV4WWH7_CAEEX|nr:hypothetical protein CEXT_319621 [Caerostris extrusa]
MSTVNPLTGKIFYQLHVRNSQSIRTRIQSGKDLLHQNPSNPTIPWNQHDANRKRQCLSRGSPPTKQRNGHWGQNAILLIRSRFERLKKEMEGISAPTPTSTPNRIHSLGGCLISPFHLNLFLPTLFSLHCLRERERQDLSFRIEIGLKVPRL